jgi:hypothetical protein
MGTIEISNQSTTFAYLVDLINECSLVLGTLP